MGFPERERRVRVGEEEGVEYWDLEERDKSRQEEERGERIRESRYKSGLE